ncbi:MAG: NAD(P)H-binding protein [Novosphingobium sp.]|nr:NAD(P)H-binding protein [Novosphingobium sp.]
MADKEQTLLVTGASGGLGQLVIENLIERHGVAPERIVAVTRSPAKLAQLAARGVQVRPGDFDDPASLDRAFAGADRALVISVDADPLDSYLSDTDMLGNPKRRRVVRQLAAVQAAERAGVRHVIYTSAPNPEPPTVCFWKRDHWHTEEAIRSGGTDWSILRMWEYPDFHLTYSWAQALGSGSFVTGAGSGRCAFIAREDCARAAAAALVRGEHGRVYDITGTQALTMDEVFDQLTAINGRPVELTHVSPQEMRARLEANGEELAPVFAAFHEGVRQGKYDCVSGDFDELAGTTPDTLDHFLRAHPVTEEQTRVTYRFADHPA